LLGYSFGGVLALELALELEAEGWKGELYLVDSSPDFIKSLMLHATGSKEHSETNLICSIFRVLAPHEATAAALTKVSHVINVKPY
jgi:thioesterase domain-containing protein